MFAEVGFVELHRPGQCWVSRTTHQAAEALTQLRCRVSGANLHKLQPLLRRVSSVGRYDASDIVEQHEV